MFVTDADGHMQATESRKHGFKFEFYSFQQISTY